MGLEATEKFWVGNKDKHKCIRRSGEVALSTAKSMTR